MENDVDVHNYGLTKREYFAAMAMKGIIAGDISMVNLDSELVASEAVEAADALIEALNNKEETDNEN